MARQTATTGNPWIPNDTNSGVGGGGSSTQDQKENDALDNLSAIANYNADALRWKANQARDMYNISDEMINRNWAKQTEDNKRNIGADWFGQMRKAQSSANQLKQSAGGAMAGSNLFNFMDLLDRENDTIRTDSLNQQRQNQNDIDNDWYSQISANINSRNELAADTEYGLKNILSDYAAQATSVAPDKIKERGLFAGDQGQGAGTINTPAWLNPNGYYDQNKTGAAETKKQDWYSPVNAQETAQQMQQKTQANASAANGNYWQKLLNSYNK